MSEELKPCPFCGSFNVSGPYGLADYIICGDCNAYGPDVEYGQDAIAAWNRRAEESDAPRDNAQAAAIDEAKAEKGATGG